MEKKSLRQAVSHAAMTGKNPAGAEYSYLSLVAAGQLAQAYEIPVRLVELTALEADIVPERYQRSMGTLGIAGQIRLLKSTVGIIGAGGLGGFALEILARMGVGRLVVVDGDTFSDSNLNRQILATEKSLGKPKADAAAKRISEVNGAVEVKAFNCYGDLSNLPEIFADCDLVLDCLDNLSSRFDLEKVCSSLNIFMIHGAIAGFLGQLAVIRPDRPLLSSIYGSIGGKQIDRGAEVQLGNPASTPAMLASWQCSEAIKILAELDDILPANKMLIIDMQSGELYKIEVDSR